MKLNLDQAVELNNALSSYEVVEIDGSNQRKNVLKAGKHLSTASYMDVMVVKKRLKNAIAEISETERTFLSDSGAAFDSDGRWKLVLTDEDLKAGKNVNEVTKNINAKMKEIKKSFSVEINTSFISQKEFIDWTKDSSTDVSAVLAEYLLKDFDVKKVE